jgi:hypothetical protein
MDDVSLQHGELWENLRANSIAVGSVAYHKCLVES